MIRLKFNSIRDVEFFQIRALIAKKYVAVSGTSSLEDMLIKLLPIAMPKVDKIEGSYDKGWADIDGE